MEIFINREGELYGPFTLEGAREYLLAGQLQADDLAWHEGLSEWATLGELLGVSTPAVAPSMLLVPGGPETAVGVAPKKSQTVSVIRIVLGLILVAVGVLVGLDHLARGKYQSANEYFNAEFEKKTSATPEQVADKLGRRPVFESKDLREVTKVYEWKSPLRVYQIQVLYVFNPLDKTVTIDAVTPKLGWRFGSGDIRFGEEEEGEEE
tara:strand:+ start:338 stop:961 length:624 start_codon:yes stop_codon:yes gene_type:complete